MKLLNSIKNFFKTPAKSSIKRRFNNWFKFYNSELANNETIFSAVTKTDDQENIMLSKKNRTDTQRIDLLAASINAFSRAITVLKPKKSIFYVPKRRKSS